MDPDRWVVPALWAEVVVSMNGMLLAVTPEQAERLRRTPGLVERVTMGDAEVNGAALASMLEEGLKGTRVGCLWSWLPGFVKRRLIAAVTGDAGLAPVDPRDGQEVDDAELEGFGEPVDLAKDWHLLHFALTGSADPVPGPAGDAILGGEAIGEDLGYGEARLLAPEAVRAVDAHLGRLGAAGIVARLDLSAVPPEVYGSDFATDEDPEEVVEALGESAEVLVTFYRAAAAQGKAALLWLS